MKDKIIATSIYVGFIASMLAAMYIPNAAMIIGVSYMLFFFILPLVWIWND